MGVNSAWGETVASTMEVEALTSLYEPVPRLKYKRYTVFRPVPRTFSSPVGVIVVSGEAPLTV